MSDAPKKVMYVDENRKRLWVTQEEKEKLQKAREKPEAK